MVNRPYLYFGGAVTALDEHSYPHDFIAFKSKSAERVLEETTPLYKKGLSLKQVAEITGIPKSTIHKTFTDTGMEIRNRVLTNRKSPNSKKYMKAGPVPFGFVYLEGKLVIDPKEQQIVLNILRLWNKGQSFRAIARHLNGKKLTTRTGKNWTHEIIKRIIERKELIKSL